MQAITFDIPAAAEKFGRVLPLPRDLALHCGCSEEMAGMVEAWWDPAFNGGWLYLSDIIIDGQLVAKGGGTKAQRTNAKQYFYTNVLLAGDYEKDDDYQEVDETHPLVQLEQPTQIDRNQNGRKPPNQRKYYLVTGETYKDLLTRASTKRGRETRAYYRGTERIVAFMRELSKEMQRRELEEKDILINRQLVTIENQQKGMLRLDQFAREHERRTVDQYIYIATTAQYSAQRHFKVGGSRDIKTFKRRFGTYMSGRPTKDEFYPIYWRVVNDYKLVEGQIEAIAGRFREKDNKEIYVMGFGRLKPIVDFAADNDCAGTAIFNELIGGVVDDLAAGNMDPPMAPVPLPGEEIDGDEVKVDAPTPLQNFIRDNTDAIKDPALQTELAAQLMGLLIEGFDFMRDKDVERRLVWKNLADTLRAAERKAAVLRLGVWKSAVRQVIKATKISCKWK